MHKVKVNITIHNVNQMKIHLTDFFFSFKWATIILKCVGGICDNYFKPIAWSICVLYVKNQIISVYFHHTTFLTFHVI